MIGALAVTLDTAGFHTVLAALQYLADSRLGQTCGRGAETVREARASGPTHARLMRPGEIGEYQAHLRRSFAHQRARRAVRVVMILDPAQYASLVAALWLYVREGFSEGVRRPAAIAAMAAGETYGLDPVRALEGEEVVTLSNDIRSIGRAPAWT